MTLRAIQFVSLADMRRQAMPGSFHLAPRQAVGLFEFIYLCPCGCGIENQLLIGKGHKPGVARPSWNWNGSASSPNLTPSVNHVDHWHGWLRDGYWEVC